MKQIKLNNGNYIPQLGLGTFLITDEAIAESTIYQAISLGYRLIDTAAVYDNEIALGNAINKAVNDGVVRREDLYISSKILAVKNSREVAKQEYNKSLKRLNLSYLDMYLIHWMPRSYDVLLDTWRGFEDLYLEGRVKNIGVCNITLYYLDRLLKDCRVKPQIIQIELHPFLQQEVLREYCDVNDIQVMSYGPFAKQHVFTNALLNDLALKYNRSIGSIVIKWGLQSNFIMIPKTTHFERLKSNFDISFTISEEDMQKINSLNDGLRFYRDPENNPYTK